MSRRGTLWLGWTLALLAMVGFAWLGTWQHGRMHEKRAMLAEVDHVLSERRAVALSAASDPARTRAYDWAAGSGSFADAPAVLLDNQMREGQAGVRVYRLFAPEQGAPLLVELGWLPLSGDRRLPRGERPQGPWSLQGLLAPPPSAGIMRAAPVVGDDSLLVLALDPDVLAAPLGVQALPPRILKLDPDLPLGHARDLDILPNTLTPEKHFGYAVQWFALALAVLVVALILTLRKPRP